MPKLPYVFLALLLTLLSLPPVCRAAAPAGREDRLAAVEAGSGALASEPPPILPGAGRLAPLHAYVSEGVETLAWKVDSFFGAPRVYREYAGNYLQMRGSVIYGRGGELELDGGIRFKIDLPNLEEKVNLVIESDEGDGTGGDRITTGTPLSRAAADKSLSAALQFVLYRRDRLDLRLQTGLRLHQLLDPLDPFVRFRGRWAAPLDDTWLTRVTLTPGWYLSRGLESRLRFDLDRATGRGALFRSSSEGVWRRDQPRDVELVQTFLFTHPLGRRSRMAYETGVTFEVDPRFRDTGYFLSTTYRRNIHRGWIYLELKPQVLWERENDFAREASFAVSLEMLFGGGFL